MAGKILYIKNSILLKLYSGLTVKCHATCTVHTAIVSIQWEKKSGNSIKQ